MNTYQEMEQAAHAFLDIFYKENQLPGFDSRWQQVKSDIQATGKYELTTEELAYGAKLAWRNSTRCIGRYFWKSLQIKDVRHIRTIDEAFQALCEHLRFATNKGKIRSLATIFSVESGLRILNRQLVRYAGYQTTEGIVGDPMDKNTDIGAINSKAQLTKIEALVKQGEKEGAQRWAPACEIPANGFFFAPTLMLGVSPANTVAREEIFGPVLSVMTFRTPQEAVTKANNTEFGLSAGIWSEKGSRILKLADQLNAGVVWANTFNQFDPTSPFGGFKESGYGREGGKQGLAAYLKGGY